MAFNLNINSKADVDQPVSVADYLPGPNALMPRMSTAVDAYIKIYINK